MKKILLISLAFMASIPFAATALTLRSKGDLRLWQTVFDRTAPLAWNWESGADAATVTFSNRMTGAVSSRAVVRETAATRGVLPQPAISATDEMLLRATVVQTTNGTEVSRMAADLAYVPGAAGQPIDVRTKARRDWHRVQKPRLATFDAAWWNVAGPTGYEILWAEPPGSYRVTRTFEGVGAVDEVTLRFGMPGFLLFAR